MDRICNPSDQSGIAHRQNLHKLFLGSVMSGTMSGIPASFGFLPSAIPHTMHLSYPSLAPISQTKHISNKPSLTLCIVTIHLLFLTPSICTHQPSLTSNIPTTYLPTPSCLQAQHPYHSRTHPPQQSSFTPNTLQSHFILYTHH